MKLITISREFGSGGRELGKRLSDFLGWDYYDREIITRIASESGLDENYVDQVLNQMPRQTITIRRSFSSLPFQTTGAELLGKEKKVIDRIAAAGKDCVIVGRNADVYLKNERPFKIFVCASREAKLERCRQRAQAGENLTDRELQRRIKAIDKGRSNIHELVGGSPWGAPSSYHLTVNTSDLEIKDIVPHIARYAEAWFERNAQRL